MKKLLTLVTLVAFVTFAKAQDFKFGKVSKEELQEKVHPIDSSANAAVLYRKENIYFQFNQSSGFTQKREVHERIKIYNKNGYDWATRNLFLYQGSTSGKNEKILNFKANTYNLIDGKIEKTKLRKDGMFEEDYNKFNKKLTYTMPNIKDGCIVEFEYKIVSPYTSIDDVYFQKEIPINKIEFSFAAPQYFMYNKLINPKAFYYPNFEDSKEEKSLSLSSKSREGWTAISTSFRNSTEKYYDNVIKLIDYNIPAIREEAFAGNIGNYVSKMSLELAAYLNDYGVVEKSFSSSWEKVSKTIYLRSSFGDQIKRTNFFKDDLASMASGANNPFQKAVVLSEYVKSKIKWNGYYGVSVYKGTKNAYKEGEGNVADINLLLIAMLKSEGVKASPVLVSTKNNGIPLYPTRSGFNYVICMVEDQGQYVLIDATEPYAPLNVLPERVLNWQGRQIKEDGSSNWVSLMPKMQSVESTSLNVKLEDDLSITGKVRQMITSNLALNYKNRYYGLSDDDKIKSFEKDKGDIEVSNIKLDNKNDGNLSVAYDYNLNDAVDDIGGKLYFSPLLFMTEKENPFKLDERKYPIDFKMPLKDKYKVNIMLPQGYKVEALPKSEVMEFKGGAVKYTFIAKQNGNFIQLSTELDLKSPIIDSADYSVFKEFYGKVVEKQAEQIVLSKI